LYNFEDFFAARWSLEDEGVSDIGFMAATPAPRITEWVWAWLHNYNRFTYCGVFDQVWHTAYGTSFLYP